eukprot:359243-Chlamydomonas_euryale.AAC.3
MHMLCSIVTLHQKTACQGASSVDPESQIEPSLKPWPFAFPRAWDPDSQTRAVPWALTSSSFWVSDPDNQSRGMPIAVPSSPPLGMRP